jgi:hypothetical protein
MHSYNLATAWHFYWNNYPKFINYTIMKTIQPAISGTHLYSKAELNSDSFFFHELTERSTGTYSNHHIETDFLPHSFEDEYDSYNSDFDLDTK